METARHSDNATNARTDKVAVSRATIEQRVRRAVGAQGCALKKQRDGSWAVIKGDAVIERGDVLTFATELGLVAPFEVVS